MCKSFNSVCKCQCGWSAQALRILAATLSGPAAFLTSTLCRMDLTWGWSSWMALTFPGRTRCVSAAICRSSWWLCSCPCSQSESLSPATCFTRCCWRAPLCAASSCVWTHWCFYSDFIVLARRPAGPRLKCRFLCPGRLLWPSHWIWLLRLFCSLLRFHSCKHTESEVHLFCSTQDKMIDFYACSEIT